MILQEKFETKVDKNGPNECWLWTGYRRRDGYGEFKVNRKTCLAHRVAWELENGLIPEGLCVLHHCDNKICVNSEHLFLGTVADNNNDMRQKGRARYGIKLSFGEKDGNSKLTTKEVFEIRALAGTMFHREIAAKFNVSRRYIGSIISRKTWKHI